jgi:hypothetical protein
MTPEQRLNRLERVVKLMIKAGLRARKQSRDQDDKINILIHSQMETNDQISRLGARTEAAIAGLAAGQARTDDALAGLAARQARTDDALAGLAAGQAKTDEALAGLAAGQARTDDALRAFINSLRRGRNGKS